jgi:hypothetical protein
MDRLSKPLAIFRPKNNTRQGPALSTTVKKLIAADLKTLNPQYFYQSPAVGRFFYRLLFFLNWPIKIGGNFG